MNRDLQDDLDRSYRYMKVYGAILTATLISYPLIAEFVMMISNSIGQIEPSPNPKLHKLFVWLSIGLAWFICVFHWQTRRKIRRLSNTRERLADGSEITHRLLANGMIAIGGANTIGVLGVVLFIVTRQRMDLYPFFVAALALSALLYPRYKQWHSWVYSSSQ